MSCTLIRSALQVCVKLRPSIVDASVRVNQTIPSYRICGCGISTSPVAYNFEQITQCCFFLVLFFDRFIVIAFSSCSSSLWSSPSSAAFPMLIKDETALFAARPRASIFANNVDWQSGQVLISGNVHWTWKECPHPLKTFQIGLSFVQSGKSHFLWLRLRD